MPEQDAYQKLVEGYREFRSIYLEEEFEAYREWASNGQSPKTLIIGCSDSRVNPALLTNAGLGEILVVNNVANIVPPYEDSEQKHLALGAAIQYAVNHIHVEHIIVMGHSGCGGISALMAGEDSDRVDASDDDYIADWVSILRPAKMAVLEDRENSNPDELACLCEMEGTLVSIQNLASYPWVRDAVKDKALTLHAWYFHVESGELLSYHPEEGRFRRLYREK